MGADARGLPLGFGHVHPAPGAMPTLEVAESAPAAVMGLGMGGVEPHGGGGPGLAGSAGVDQVPQPMDGALQLGPDLVRVLEVEHAALGDSGAVDAGHGQEGEAAAGDKRSEE